ncbi:hypothetical protein C8Q75DRAFT_803560 [Abortiporus biennis]|nr:hypothetical protein C8Q75DRAFT_803560 [Abortiporus biennis]
MFVDFDVLLLIMDFVEHAQGVLAFSKTCKTLYSRRIPKLLGCPLRFSDYYKPSRAQTFIYLLNEDPSYFKYVRNISVDSSEEPQESFVGNITTSLMQKGTNLQYLKVSVIKTVTTHLFPPISSPISCNKLQYLQVRDLDQYAMGMLKRLNAPLKCLVVTFPRDDPRGQSIHPVISLLENFTKTLEELSVSHVTWPQIGTPYSPLQFPRLHTLTCKNSFSDNLGHIIHAFPNLKTLELPDSCSHFDLENTRRVNMIQRTRLQESKHLWNSLETVKGFLETLYGFAFQDRVKDLDIQTNVQWRSPFTVDKLFILMVNMQPTRLKLSLDVSLAYSIISRQDCESFHNVFAYPGLTHLNVYVALLLQDETDLEVLIIELVAALESTESLEVVSLTLRWMPRCDETPELDYDIPLPRFSVESEDDDTSIDSDIDASYIEGTMDPFYIAMLLTFAAGPSLKYIIINTVTIQYRLFTHDQTVKTEGWEVEHSDKSDEFEFHSLTGDECAEITSKSFDF